MSRMLIYFSVQIACHGAALMVTDALHLVLGIQASVLLSHSGETAIQVHE